MFPGVFAIIPSYAVIIIFRNFFANILHLVIKAFLRSKNIKIMKPYQRRYYRVTLFPPLSCIES